MSSVNKVILIGNVGKDVDVRYMPSGDAVANLTLATSENWTDKSSGEKKEATEWHRISFFGRLAEVVGEYVKKGAKIYVEGKLQTRKWQDKDGTDRYTTEIRADNMKMLDKRQRDGGGEGQSEAQPAPRERQSSTAAKPAKAAGSSGFDDMDDDVPF